MIVHVIISGYDDAGSGPTRITADLDTAKREVEKMTVGVRGKHAAIPDGVAMPEWTHFPSDGDSVEEWVWRPTYEERRKHNAASGCWLADYYSIEAHPVLT